MKILKQKLNPMLFIYIFFAPLVVAGIPMYSEMGTSLHQTCLDKWHFILSLVDVFLVITYFHHANISYSIKAS